MTIVKVILKSIKSKKIKIVKTDTSDDKIDNMGLNKLKLIMLHSDQYF